MAGVPVKMPFRVRLVLAAAMFLGGCPRSSSPERTEGAANAANADASIDTLSTNYPIDLGPAPAMAAAAVAQSDALDAQCAFMTMSPSLAEKRPAGLGCPRPDANTTGAQ